MARTTFAALIAIVLAGGCADRTQTKNDTQLLEISDSLNAWNSPAAPVAAPAATTGQPPVHAMIGGLEKKLADNPNDVKGWSLLAQSYAFTGRMQEAREAGEKAISLGADSDEMHARIARAHTGMAN